LLHFEGRSSRKAGSPKLSVRSENSFWADSSREKRREGRHDE